MIWPLSAQEVVATREYHQLTKLPGGFGGYFPHISGDTVYFPRKVEDGTRYEIYAVDAAGGPPRVIDNWVIAENGELNLFSCAGTPVMAGNAVVRYKGRNIVELNQPVITSVSGPLFSVGFGANIRDSTMKLDTGVYRITDGGYETVLTSQKIAGVLGVLPVEVGRIESLSSSADGKRFAALAYVHSERPAAYSKNGWWFITWDGANLVVMNEDNRPYNYKDNYVAPPIFAISGDGSQIAWGDYDWKNIRITPFGQPGGRTIFSGEGLHGIQPGKLPRFFYSGQRLAVLMGDSGYAALAEGGPPFEVTWSEVSVFRNPWWVYTDERSRGLFAGYCHSPHGAQVCVMRLNTPRNKRRGDAPLITQYSLDPAVISNDLNRPSKLRVVVQSQHPVQEVDCSHLKDGLTVRGETATTALFDNGGGNPDEVARDNVWTGTRWVYPQATGVRNIRITALNRDSAEMYHAFGIEVGSYRIGDPPPPSNPDLVDVVPPTQRSDDDPGIAGTGSASGTGSGSGQGGVAGSGAGPGGAVAGSTGNSGGRGAGNNPGGNPGGGSGAGGIPGAGTGTMSGSGGSGNTANPGVSGTGRGGGTGSAGNSGTLPDPSRPAIEVGRRDVQPGEITRVPVYLRNPLGTANLNVEIRYDTRVVQPAGEIIRGNALPDATLFSANAGETGILRIGFAGSSLVPADGTIAEVVFRAVGQPGQSTELPPVVTKMNTVSSEPLTPVTTSGSVRIVPRRTPGDFDGDGRLTAADALAALEMSVRLRPTELNLDMDADGSVTSLDASLILRTVVGG